MEESETLYALWAPLVAKMGCVFVDVSISRHQKETKIHLILHKEGGISLNELAAAQKVLRPRLELEWGRDDFSMDVSSPGLNRVFKAPREYEIFKGSPVKLLVGEVWQQGRLLGVDKDWIILETSKEKQRIPVGDVRKGKLDF